MIKSLGSLIPIVALQGAVFPRVADLAFSTDFLGSEGYTTGTIDNSIHTGAPFFNETSTGGMYRPGGGAPTFGTLRQSPTAAADHVIYTAGEGSAFSYTARAIPESSAFSMVLSGGVLFVGVLRIRTASST